MNTKTEITQKNSNRILWIDAAKFAAIMAVYLDHCYVFVTEKPTFVNLSFFSVSLFILLMGITSYQSCKRSSFDLKNKLKKILLPYLGAVFIYHIFDNKGFNLETYLADLVHFNHPGHLYYVLVYIQLAAITPVIFYIFKKTEGIKNVFLRRILAFVIIIFISVLATNHTYITSAFGGGRALFGGTYLILFYLGMWFADVHNKITLQKKQSLYLLIISASMTLIWMTLIALKRFKFDRFFPFYQGINPPGLTLCVYSTLILLTFYSLGNLLTFYPQSFLNKIFKIFASAGRHTLYMYLYHWLILVYIYPKITNKYGYFFNSFKITNIIFMTIAVFIPIGIEHITKYLMKKLNECYR